MTWCTELVHAICSQRFFHVMSHYQALHHSFVFMRLTEALVNQPISKRLRVHSFAATSSSKETQSTVETQYRAQTVLGLSIDDETWIMLSNSLD